VATPVLALVAGASSGFSGTGERPFRRLFCLMMGGHAVRLLAG
jgi:hypothetical protein